MREQVICTVNKIPDVDLAAIKCSICGETMEISGYEGGRESLERERYMKEGLLPGAYIPAVRRIYTNEAGISLTCPYCKAELKVTQCKEIRTKERKF